MRVYFLANRIFVATFERVLNFRKIRRNVWQLFMQSYWNSCLINFFTIYIYISILFIFYTHFSSTINQISLVKFTEGKKENKR